MEQPINIKVQVKPEDLEDKLQYEQTSSKEFTVKQIINYSDVDTKYKKTSLKLEAIVYSVGAALETCIGLKYLPKEIDYIKKYNWHPFAIVCCAVGIAFSATLAIILAHKARKAKKKLNSINATLNEQQILRVGERLEGVSPSEYEYDQISDAIHERDYIAANALLDRLEIEKESNELNDNERAELEDYRNIISRFSEAVANQDQNSINEIAGELIMAGKSIEEEQKGPKL